MKSAIKYASLVVMLFVLHYFAFTWYYLYSRIESISPTFQGWSIFWRTFTANPSLLFFRNWGEQTSWVPIVVAAAIILTILQKRRMLPYGVEPVDSPWQFIAIAVPLTLVCQAYIGVGSYLNWFWDSVHGVPNDLFSFTAHFAAALGLGLWVAVFDLEGMLNWANRWKWLFLLVLLMILGFYWENLEAADLLARGGIPTPEFYTNMRDSVADLLADFLGGVLALGLYDRVWDYVHLDGMV